LLFWDCTTKSVPEPEASILIAPANLNECKTATSINAFEKQVKFEWTLALHADSYELVIENTLTNAKITKTSSLLTESIVLPSGAPYRWYVNSKSLLSTAVGKSSVWQFYLEGSPEESHLPFPAVLTFPENNASVDLDATGELIFLWEGHDLDQDIARYAFYLGTAEDALELIEEGLISSQVSVNLNSGTTYFWQVWTYDSEKNASKSEVYSFQTSD
jgi:hypothetical protein